MSDYETCGEIEIAIARYFGILTHVIVPNVNGMFPYEMDLCVLNKSMYAYEVEIKVSKSDLKRDSDKRHHHEGHSFSCHCDISRLWFAMPEKMENCAELVPLRAGIFLVDKTGYVRVLRHPQINKAAKKWSAENAYKLSRLSSIRAWKQRDVIKQCQERIKELSLADKK